MDPEGPCQQCKHSKQGCSLFIKNPNTKKADRRQWTRQEFFAFREKQKAEQAGERSKILETRKRRAHGSPSSGNPDLSPSDTGEPGLSAPVPSPSLPTAGLRALTLDSSASSAANTPAESPMMAPPLPLPQKISPAPSTSREPRRASDRATERPIAVPQHPPPRHSSRALPDGHTFGHIPTAGKSPSKPPVTNPIHRSAEVSVVIPHNAQFLRPAPRQSSHSRSDASPASDDGELFARIAAVERRQERIETWMRDIDTRVKRLEKK